MKKLTTADVFSLARVLKTSGMREELKKKIQSLMAKGEDMDVESIGIDGILIIIESLAEKGSEQAIYEFLSNPFEMDPKEVSQLELMDLVQKLEQLSNENDLVSFFKYVSGILGKN